MPRSLGRGGARWRALQARVWAEETHCWLCHQPVDMRLRNHALARSVDHLRTLAHHGPPVDRRNARLAHIGCNAARGNRLRHVPASRCACTLGQPCAPLHNVAMPTLVVDASTV